MIACTWEMGAFLDSDDRCKVQALRLENCYSHKQQLRSRSQSRDIDDCSMKTTNLLLNSGTLIEGLEFEANCINT